MTKDVQEFGDSKAGTVTSLGGEASATGEADLTLQSLLSSLSNPDFRFEDLPYLMMRYMLSLRLLGSDDEWVSDELKGYSIDKELPTCRWCYCDTEYVAVESDKVIKEAREIRGFNESVGFIVNLREKGWVHENVVPNCPITGSLAGAIRRVKVGQFQIDIILDGITVELYDRASKTLVTAKFGAAIDTIFRDYQKLVGSAMANLEINDHLETAYRNLKGGDGASWRAAALACRNVLHDLSAKLWCVQCIDYNFGDGRGLVKLNNPRIKLRAYMREIGLDKQDIPVALLEPVYAQGSAGKMKCSYEAARSVLIMTYLFVAELIRETDMEPIMEIKKRV
jgi:hypothetical protein